jgi:hypothetical protein
LQKQHSSKLHDLIEEYNPETIERTWGQDDEYLRISSHLREVMNGESKMSLKKLIGTNVKKIRRRSKK